MSDQDVNSVRSASSLSGWRVAARVMSAGAALAVVVSVSRPWVVEQAQDWSDSGTEYSRSDLARQLLLVDGPTALEMFVQYGMFVLFGLAAAAIVRSFSGGWSQRADQVLLSASAVALVWALLAVNDLQGLLDDGSNGGAGLGLLLLSPWLTLGAVASIWFDGRRSRKPKLAEFAVPNPTSRVG